MVIEKKYSNGLTFLYEQLPLKSMSFCVLVRSGSIYETPKNYGVAHFLEHTLFKGTTNRTEFQLAKDLEENAIYSNAATSKIYTLYYTSSTLEQLENSIEIMSDMFFNSIFDEKGHEIERKAIMEEYNGKVDRASSKTSINLSSALFSNSCYEIPTLGTAERINNLTIDDLKDFYNQHYTADNVIISFSGGAKIEDVEKLLDKYFINKFSNRKSDKITPSFDFQNKKYIFESKDINQSIMEIGYMLDVYDLKTYRMIDLFSIIFSSGMNSRLFERLRNQLGLCYTVGGSKLRLKEYQSAYIISIKANQKDELLALQEIEKEVDKMIEFGISLDEFKKAKNNALRDLIFDSEYFQNRGISNARIYNAFEKITSDEEELEILNSITYDELNDFCKKLLCNRDKCLSIISKTESNELKNYWLQNNGNK